MKSIATLLVLLALATKESRGIEPATITVDRNWNIPESTKVGTIVKTVNVQGENNQTRTYSLELEANPFSRNQQENPFWIDPQTGYVYLNTSLEGWVSELNAISATN